METELNTGETELEIKTGGFATARCNLIKSGVYRYKASKIRLPKGFTDKEFVDIWYSDEELSKPETLDSFKHNTLTIGHPESCDISTWKDITQGEVSTDITFKDGVVSGTIIGKGPEAMAEFLKSGKDAKHQLSAGIYSGYIAIPGKTPDGEHYDLKAVDIGSEHVAMCKIGKAGELCRVLTDSESIKEFRVLLGFEAERIDADASQTDEDGSNPDSLNNNAIIKDDDTMAKDEENGKKHYLKLDNSEDVLFLPDAETKLAVQKALKSLQTDHDNKLKLNNSAHEGEKTTWGEEKQGLLDEIAQLKHDASPEVITARAQEKLSLMNSADAIGADKTEMETMTPRECKIHLLNSVDCDLEIDEDTTDTQLDNMCKMLPLKLDNSEDGTQKNDFSGKTVNKGSDKSHERKHVDALVNACKPQAQKGA